MRLLRTLAVAVLAALALPALAGASGADVIADCTKHGTLTRRYSQKDYRQALANLPADIEEYGNCRNVIRGAQISRAARRGRGGAAAFRTPGSPAVATASGTGGTKAGRLPGAGGDDPTAVDPQSPSQSNPTTAEENRALIDATRNGGGAVRVGRDAIAPSATASDRYAKGLPTPLVGVLALLGVAAIVGAALAVRRRLRGSSGE
jgi:hypothetical protein